MQKIHETCALLAAGGVLLVTVACGPKEPNFEATANTALDNARLADVDANYDDDAKVVHLTGTVTSEGDRTRAGDVVKQAIANGAQVANEVTVAGGHTETADDLDSGIETRLKNLVELDGGLKNSNVDFDANNGVVTVTGQVPSEDEKRRVSEMARREAGVKDVINSLEVRPTTAP
jgi:osmotically-inducible protein OsmY